MYGFPIRASKNFLIIRTRKVVAIKRMAISMPCSILLYISTILFYIYSSFASFSCVRFFSLLPNIGIAKRTAIPMKSTIGIQFFPIISPKGISGFGTGISTEGNSGGLIAGNTGVIPPLGPGVPPTG